MTVRIGNNPTMTRAARGWNRSNGCGLVAALVALTLLCVVPSSVAADSRSDRADHRGRLVIEGVRCVDPSVPLDAVLTVVIENGRVVALAPPGTVEIGEDDRLINGAGRTLRPARHVVIESDTDALDLRLRRVEGVTEATLVDGAHAACLSSLADIASMRMPRIEVVPLDDLALARRRAEGMRIAVGQSADLLLYEQLGDQARNPVDRPARLHLVLMAREDSEPAGVRILYPGELAVLAPLVERLRSQHDDAVRDAGSVMHALSSGRVALPADHRRGRYAVDAIERGLVWSWSSAGADGTRSHHTLFRALEPLHAWAHVTEIEHPVDGLRSIELTVIDDRALAELLETGQRAGARPLVLRARMDIEERRLVMHRPMPPSGEWREIDELPHGGLVAVRVEGVPTGRLGEVVVAAESRTGRLDLLDITIDPVSRGVQIAAVSVDRVESAACGPDRTVLESHAPAEMDVRGYRVTGRQNDPPLTVWLDAAGPRPGRLWSTAEIQRFGFIHFRIDPNASSVPSP